MRARELADLVASGDRVLYRRAVNWNVATSAAARANRQETFDGLGLRFVTQDLDGEYRGVYAVKKVL